MPQVVDSFMMCSVVKKTDVFSANPFFQTFGACTLAANMALHWWEEILRVPMVEVFSVAAWAHS